jgi:hypothetical protein
VNEVVVDVALPAYRRATYIGEAIESVLSQSHANWRLTVCDNGPGGGDVERALAPYLADPRVAHLVTGHELPLAENWTKALNAGTSLYVALLNDDDRWHPDFLAVRIEALEAHAECGFAFGAWVQIDESGSATWLPPLRFSRGVLSRELLADCFTRTNIVVPSAVVLRRSALQSVGPAFDGRWHYCDWEMWARLGAHFPVYYVAARDSDYRRHVATNTLATREQPDTLVDMVEHIERLFTRELPDFTLSRRSRARNRSQILLHSAADVHSGGGWRASAGLYWRAIREYPPTIVDPISLRLVARTLLGRRAMHALGQVLRPFHRHEATGESSDGRPT